MVADRDMSKYVVPSLTVCIGAAVASGPLVLLARFTEIDTWWLVIPAFGILAFGMLKVTDRWSPFDPEALKAILLVEAATLVYGVSIGGLAIQNFGEGDEVRAAVELLVLGSGFLVVSIATGGLRLLLWYKSEKSATKVGNAAVVLSDGIFLTYFFHALFVLFLGWLELLTVFD